MKQIRLVYLIFAITALCGCSTIFTREYSAAFFAMDTVMELTVYGSGAEEAALAAEEKVNYLGGLMSVTNPDSEIYAVNTAQGLPVAVSDDTFDLIDKALSISRRTGGAMDISVYPVVLAWGFTTAQTRVPGKAELEALLPLVDYTAVNASGGEITVPPGVMLDLGSVAKGYCGDVLAADMKNAGITSAILRLGGNIHTVGAKPDGSAWNVAVQDPLDSARYIGVVAVEDKAVVTSGGYERFFTQDGSTYWHIFDPETGKPAQTGIISVTIISESGVLCDGLSTALFVMGRQRALEHYRQHRDFEAIIVTDDGVVTITPGLEGVFTLADTGGGYILNVMDGEE